MREFPERLNVKNKEKFVAYHYDRVLCYLRKAIFEHMIIEKENTYYCLDDFARINRLDNEGIHKMAATIIEELSDLGWNCKTAFRGTAVFIYSTDEPPPSCYPDSF
jgi:hypothetical protein